MKDNLWEETKLEQSKKHEIDGVEIANHTTRKIKIKLEKNECENIWTKNCPNCNIELFYKSPISYKRSIRDKVECKKCSFSKRIVQKCNICKKVLWINDETNTRHCVKCEKIEKLSGNLFIKKCKTCQKDILYKSEITYKRSLRSGVECKSCSKLGEKNPSKNLIGDLNPSRRPDVRTKLRISRRKQIEDRYGHQISPNYNISFCKLILDIEKEFNWNGLHAENGGEFYIESLGYWLDYYEPNLNIVIEFDEKHHKFQKEKDFKRQSEITDFLKCKFYRIKEEEKHLWKQILTS